MVRRVGLALVVIIAIILIAVLVNSCETSARNSALKDYNNSVASLNEQSVQTGSNFFKVLSGGTSNPTSMQQGLNEAVGAGATQLSKAKGLGVPDEVKGAQQDFVQALQLRHDGMTNVANNVQSALQSQTSKDAVDTIAAEMAKFYASDVLYKDYSVPMIVGALRAAGITVGGLGGQQLNASQFLPSIQWLDPVHVASVLHVTLPSSSSGQPKNIAPGLHGHELNSVTVGGSTLQTGSSNSIPASPPPTFTLNFTNSGQNTETNVICRVTIAGSKVNGQTIIPQTTAGETTNCEVTLSSAPPKGSQTVKVEVVPVPGETKTANNTLTFPVTFQ
jgi:hypothetical protein